MYLINYFQKSPIKKNQFSLGFTLVELLVVIGVLGVLAAAVLVAINPLEQLARGRDTQRVATITSVGKAWSQWSATLNAYYPTAAANWQAVRLVASGDLKKRSEIPNPQQVCGGVANRDSNVAPINYLCYAPIPTGSLNTDFVVWIRGMESKQMLSRVGGSCPGGQTRLTIVYFGSRGKPELTCLGGTTTIPTLADTYFDI